MRQLELTTAFFDDTLAITCIENSLVGYLKYLKLPYQSLYCYSYIRLDEVIKDFISYKYDYINYYKLPRLQKVASDLHLAYISVNRISHTEMLQILSQKTNEGIPILLHIDPLKIHNNGQLIPWRDNHYILAYKIEDEKVYLLDDYPKRQFQMSIGKLNDAYKGEFVFFNIINKFNENDYKNNVLKVLREIKEIDLMPINKEMYSFDELIRLRDALGILRITRRRIDTWIRWLNEKYDLNINNEYITYLLKLINILDKLYSIVEFYRLKCKVNNESIEKLLEEAFLYENKWIKCL